MPTNRLDFCLSRRRLHWEISRTRLFRAKYELLEQVARGKASAFEILNQGVSSLTRNHLMFISSFCRSTFSTGTYLLPLLTLRQQPPHVVVLLRSRRAVIQRQQTPFAHQPAPIDHAVGDVQPIDAVDQCGVWR